ncbi:MAG TPA: GNAT family N-acetyltransferase [Flavobacteriales bacterium]|nr:GNAT family N-acetyltransferase [Flavobacteriales bacterium]|tara:strand:- start:76 stop:552 length:477 start_codon:yes stop_codon:yes gene_type:complete
MNNIEIREARVEDCDSMVDLITELAIYEKAEKEMEMTAVQLERDGFGENPLFHVIVAEKEAEIIGMAFYYYKYSTWKGSCLYLEDLVVREASRKDGVGSKLFEAVIRVAKLKKVKRMEWQVLDWNEPAINFYNKYNAELDPEWINGRFYEKDLEGMAF